MGAVRVNIGAGQTRIPGFVNVDVSPRADVTLDLNRDRLPFDDDVVDVVFSYHTLEHLDGYLHALGEIHRVLRHGGRLLVGVPYVTLTEYNLVNPYHRQHFNEHSFDFFDRAKLKGSAAEGDDVVFRSVFHRYHYIGGFNLVPPPLRGWCRRHLFNTVRKIDFGLLAVKSAPPPEVDRTLAKRMRAEFDECLAARVPYDADASSAAARRGAAYRAARGVALWWRGASR